MQQMTSNCKEVSDFLCIYVYLHILEKCNIAFSQLEALAADRDTWESTCETGLTTFLAASD